MVKIMKKTLLLILMLCAVAALNGCKGNPSEEQLYSKLLSHFARHGFTFTLSEIAEDRSVPIYHASAWRKLTADQEEVLVYFDESNRADYLLDGIDQTPYTYAGRMRLRFILLYEGENEALLEALRELPED